MSSKNICLKQYINNDDFKKIEALKNICIKREDIFLKLETDYKLNISQFNNENSYETMNELFYYEGESLIGYVGICNFGGEAGEITGMVHPDYRRKGIGKRLFDLAKEECRRRGFKSILLICDNNSTTGLEFIKTIGATYSFSEYEMKLKKTSEFECSKDIILRKATNFDVKEIAKQNGIYFGASGRIEVMPEDEEKRNRITYLVENKSVVIGKIRIDISDNEGFISGFGIYPEFRGMGYGKKALKAALKILYENNIQNIALEVAAQNKNALNLYKSCGFEEGAIMNYYEIY